MSNLIKGCMVNYGQDARLLDMNERADGFRSLYEEAVWREETSKAVEEGVSGSSEDDLRDSFVPGLFAESVVIKGSEEETISEQEKLIRSYNEQIKELNDKEKELRRKISTMLDDAEEEATRIVQEASAKAQAERERVIEEYRQKGYAEGADKLYQEHERLKREYEAKVQENNDKYEKQVEELEPAFVGLLIKYIEKLTGIYAGNRSEVIMHVIHQALTKQTHCRNFIVRVSREDYGTVLNMKPEILLWVPEESQIEVVEDKILKPGDCLIETDSRIFDCGLDTQAKSLIEDIRILAGD